MGKTKAEKARDQEDLEFAYEYLYRVLGAAPEHEPEEGYQTVYVVSTSSRPPVYRMKLLVISHGELVNITPFAARVLGLRYGRMGDIAMEAMGDNAHHRVVWDLSVSLYGVANRGGYRLAYASL